MAVHKRRFLLLPLVLIQCFLFELLFVSSFLSETSGTEEQQQHLATLKHTLKWLAGSSMCTSILLFIYMAWLMQYLKTPKYGVLRIYLVFLVLIVLCMTIGICWFLVHILIIILSSSCFLPNGADWLTLLGIVLQPVVLLWSWTHPYHVAFRASLPNRDWCTSSPKPASFPTHDW